MILLVLLWSDVEGMVVSAALSSFGSPHQGRSESEVVLRQSRVVGRKKK